MKKRRDNLALPMAEMSVLKELEEFFQASDSRKRGETIPVQREEHLDRSSHDIGLLIENNAAVALSIRYCALTALPSSIDQLTSLRELDLTGNRLTALPEAPDHLRSAKQSADQAPRVTSQPGQSDLSGFESKQVRLSPLKYWRTGKAGKTRFALEQAIPFSRVATAT